MTVYLREEQYPEAINREWLKSRIRQAISNATNYVHDEATIERYMSDAYLDASIKGAIGKFGQQTRRRLIEGLPAHFKANEVSPQEAQEIINNALEDWWRPIALWREYQLSCWDLELWLSGEKQ